VRFFVAIDALNGVFHLMVCDSNCLSGSPLFAPHVFPLMLEKLEASTADVKVESLVAIERCARAFGRSIVINYANEIWLAVTKEVRTRGDNRTRSLSPFFVLLSFLRCVLPLGASKQRIHRFDRRLSTDRHNISTVVTGSRERFPLSSAIAPCRHCDCGSG
jgi:hypothetical protein